MTSALDRIRAYTSHFGTSPMMQVLIANGLWLSFLTFWCVLYFIQRGADEKGGSHRYPPYVAPHD